MSNKDKRNISLSDLSDLFEVIKKHLYSEYIDGADDKDVKEFIGDIINRIEINARGAKICLDGRCIAVSRCIENSKEFVSDYLRRNGYSEKLGRKIGYIVLVAGTLIESLCDEFRDAVSIGIGSFTDLEIDEKIDTITNRPEVLLNMLIDTVKSDEDLKRFVKNEDVLRDPKKFSKLRTEVKASIISKALERYFRFARVSPIDPLKGEELYVLDRNTLYSSDRVIDPVIGVLEKFGYVRRSMRNEVKQALYSSSQVLKWEYLNPWNKLNLRNGVLDLEELKIYDDDDSYFTYRLDISITQREIDEIVSGSYNIEENPVYKLWRNHFDDDNWNHFTDSIGTILSPWRHKHIAFIIGPSGVGKSTLLFTLTRPIAPIVANVSLRSLTGYTFGLEGLIGKQIIVYAERGDTVLKNLDIVNQIVGENDYIEVHRKHRPSVRIRSLKTMIISMNDPPIVVEYGGETFNAFLKRLSIIFMGVPENFKPLGEKEIMSMVSNKDAFKFLLWCRVQLERNGWRIRKMSEDDMYEYLMKSMNSAIKFLEECVAEDPISSIKGKELYIAYKKWCETRKLRPIGLFSFYSVVETRYRSYDREGSKWFKGIKLKCFSGEQEMNVLMEYME